MYLNTAKLLLINSYYRIYYWFLCVREKLSAEMGQISLGQSTEVKLLGEGDLVCFYSQ